MLDRADERQLLAALARGERRAAEVLVERTYRTLYAALVRMTGGDVELAADLTQDTYRKAWQSLARFDGRSAFTTWLYRIAYTTFLNHVRRPARLVPLADGHDPPRDPDPPQEERLDRALAAVRLRRAVLDLPEDLRYTVTARYWADLPVKEIARHEGVTPVAIRKRLKKAAQLLALALEETTR